MGEKHEDKKAHEHETDENGEDDRVHWRSKPGHAVLAAWDPSKPRRTAFSALAKNRAFLVQARSTGEQ